MHDECRSQAKTKEGTWWDVCVCVGERMCLLLRCEHKQCANANGLLSSFRIHND